MDRAKLEEEIREAFRGVVLGNGVSLGEAQVLDRAGDGFSDADRHLADAQKRKMYG